MANQHIQVIDFRETINMIPMRWNNQKKKRENMIEDMEGACLIEPFI